MDHWSELETESYEDALEEGLENFAFARMEASLECEACIEMGDFN
jgi:hypothetical protein